MKIEPESWTLLDEEVQALFPKSWKRMEEIAKANGVTDLDQLAQIVQGWDTLNDIDADEAVIASVALLEAEFNTVFAPSVITLSIVDGGDEQESLAIGHEWVVDNLVELNKGAQKLMKALENS